MEKKVKKSGVKFNIIDVILLVVILAVVGVMAYILLSGRFETAAPNVERQIQYSVLLTNVRGEFMDNIEIGNSVVDTVNLMPIGEVVDVKSVEAVKQYEDELTASVINAVVPDTYDVTVIIKATAGISTGYYMIGGYQIAVGTLVSLRVPNFTGSGFCTSIEEVSA